MTLNKENIYQNIIKKNNINYLQIFHKNKSFYKYIINNKILSQRIPLYSISKSITSIIFLDKLKNSDYSLNTKLFEIPLFKKNYINLFKTDFFNITLRDLLNMQSGIKWYESTKWNYKIPTKNKSLLHFIANQDFSKKRIKHFSYNSGNTFLISIIFNYLFNISFEQELQDFFAKLDMSFTINKNYKTDIDDNLFSGSSYMLSIKKLQKLHHFINSNFFDNNASFPNLLKKNEILTKTKFGNYSLHWWIYTKKDFYLYYAFGIYGQFLFYIPKLNINGIILANNSIETSFNPLRNLINII